MDFNLDRIQLFDVKTVHMNISSRDFVIFPGAICFACVNIEVSVYVLWAGNHWFLITHSFSVIFPRAICFSCVNIEVSVYVLWAENHWFLITHLFSLVCRQADILNSDNAFMMTSSNGNIFRVNDHLCGEFNAHRWIPRTKASDAELWCFLWSAPEPTVKLTIVRLVIWDAIVPIMTSL